MPKARPSFRSRTRKKMQDTGTGSSNCETVGWSSQPRGSVMILDSFQQDVRVGLRVLFKEKAFCFLAVLVLGLGIGGATTQFTIVNAIVLRGFSFPHPEQLMSVGLIDPKASDQNNNFGIAIFRPLRTTKI